MTNGPHTAWTPLSLNQVTMTEGFWSEVQKTVREASLPHMYDWLKKSGRLDAFTRDQDADQFQPHIFWDSDVYKWLEAAAYAWAQTPDACLKQQIDDVVDRISRAQQPDGYLNSYFTAVHPERRFTDIEGAHELYCAGHLFEAAVAHYQATGSEDLLTVAKKYADYLTRTFGPQEGKIHGYPGHEEVELALIKLYHATGQEKYLGLAEYFVNQRGVGPNFFDQETSRRTYPGSMEPLRGHIDIHEYNQSYCPVREQQQVVGHAVRAMYLYCAIVDLYVETGDKSLLQTSKRLWHNMVSKRMYITGGIGSSKLNEGFTEDYDLPLDEAYCETCAAIGSVFWNHRLVQIECADQYADLMERTLYNAVIPAMSWDGCRFFYDNPMLSDGTRHRSEWFACSCCPPNLARLVLSLGHYIYSQSLDEVAVYLYVGSRAEITMHQAAVTLEQRTTLPYGDSSTLMISLKKPDTFGIRIRMPHWSRGTSFFLNEDPIEPQRVKGYAVITRRWQDGDTIRVKVTKEVTRVYSHPQVVSCRSRVALQYGPVVYCLEEADNGSDLDAIVLDPREEILVDWDADLGGGCEVLRFSAGRLTPSNPAQLYDTRRVHTATPVQAVPYYLWDNRTAGEMVMWVREE